MCGTGLWVHLLERCLSPKHDGWQTLSQAGKHLPAPLTIYLAAGNQRRSLLQRHVRRRCAQAAQNWRRRALHCLYPTIPKMLRLAVGGLGSRSSFGPLPHRGFRRVEGKNEDDVKGKYSGNPVIFAIDIPAGFIALPFWNPRQRGPRPDYGHTVVIIGYDDLKQAYHFGNSWGTHWGEKNFGWISYRSATALWQEGYVMQVESAAPVPRRYPSRQLRYSSSATTGSDSAASCAAAAARPCRGVPRRPRRKCHQQRSGL